MDPRPRALFNAGFSEEIDRAYARGLEERVGDIPFRLAETPVFVPEELNARLREAAEAIVDQLSEPERIEQMRRAIPARWDTPGMDVLPNFAQVDFAIVRGAGGELTPRLIELQGFPSLTAFQVAQLEAWEEQLQKISGLEGRWSCWFGMSRNEFIDFARRTIVGDHDPREVILMDIDPPSQKTAPDFVATKRFFDVDAVCPTTLEVRGRRLWRRDSSGQSVPVRRIYNRVVFDELERKALDLPFDYREDLDVEWAPHPNWYWVWSKYSLPFLDHWSVPRARFVSRIEATPGDLQNYVLKPLFSFAGSGVNVDPTPEDIERIPHDERESWCLQEKIEYAPVLEAVDGGGVKVEIRMMFLRPDGEAKPRLVQNLARLSRGKMHGVDFNKDFSWVGSSIGVWREGA
jgi:hypothetical protein